MPFTTYVSDYQIIKQLSGILFLLRNLEEKNPKNMIFPNWFLPNNVKRVISNLKSGRAAGPFENINIRNASLPDHVLSKLVKKRELKYCSTVLSILSEKLEVCFLGNCWFFQQQWNGKSAK
jgi:hypothetical protein